MTDKESGSFIMTLLTLKLFEPFWHPSLGSGCIMRFIKGTEVVDIEVPRCSLYEMQDEVRYKWKHAIPLRKKDIIDGNVQRRERRWSITYRKVKMNKVRPINPNGKVAGMLRGIYHVNIKE
jgi:hypothetical protein